MNKISVKIKILDESAKIPAYATEFAAGADLYANIKEEIEIKPGERVKIPTGIAIEPPCGVVSVICARSGLATKHGIALANGIGVVDSDYRGECMVALQNHSDEAQTIEGGERIAQMAIVPFLKAEYEVTEELSDTVRGAGGFGSTGRK